MNNIEMHIYFVARMAVAKLQLQEYLQMILMMDKALLLRLMERQIMA